MAAKLNQFNLYSKAMVLIGSVLAVITVLVTAWNVYNERMNSTRDLEARLQETLTQQAIAVSNSLWDLNRDSTSAILQGIAQYPDFVCVTVSDQKGGEFAHLGPRNLTGIPIVRGMADITFDQPNGSKEKIGTIELVFSRERLLEAQARHLTQNVILLLVQLAAVLTATAIVLRALTKPLNAITDRMIGVAGGDGYTPTPYTERHDQIGAMARAVEICRENQARLQAILDNTQALIYLKDLAGKYILVNREFEKSFSVFDGEAIGKTDFDLHSLETAQEFRDHDRRVQEFGVPMEFEESAVYVDGRHTTVTVKFPLIGPSGKIYAIAGISTDITERKRAELALKRTRDELEERVRGRTAELSAANAALVMEIKERKRAEDALCESEERFRSIVENIPAVVCLKDLDGHFQVANDRLEEWYGISVDGALGKSSSELFPPALADICESLDRQALESGALREREMPVPFTDGSNHSILMMKFPVLGKDREPVGVGTINMDLTELRQAEKRLHRAQKLEVVGQLTGGIAHDFNNLLSVIQGHAELFADGNGHGEESANMVIRAARRGAELTRKLLAFSRQQSLQPSSIDIAALVNGSQNCYHESWEKLLKSAFLRNRGFGRLTPIPVKWKTRS